MKVYAQGQQVWGLDPHLPADSFAATLTFADGSVHCYIQHGASRNGTLRKYHYQLFGRDHQVYLSERFKKCITHDASGAVTQAMVFEGPDFGGEGIDDVRGPFGYMGHYDELAHLCDCIRTGSTPQMTARHGLQVLAVEKAILESITTGMPVDFAVYCERQGIESSVQNTQLRPAHSVLSTQSSEP
jgi:predicted dehydrogenase